MAGTLLVFRTGTATLELALALKNRRKKCIDTFNLTLVLFFDLCQPVPVTSHFYTCKAQVASYNGEEFCHPSFNI